MVIVEVNGHKGKPTGKGYESQSITKVQKCHQHSGVNRWQDNMELEYKAGM